MPGEVALFQVLVCEKVVYRVSVHAQTASAAKAKALDTVRQAGDGRELMYVVERTAEVVG